VTGPGTVVERVTRGLGPVPGRAGPGLRLLARAAAHLPHGRSRLARALSRYLRRPFVDAVYPRELGVRLVIDPRDPFQVEIWLGAYQPNVVSFLRQSVAPGSVVLCAGLHVGYIASLASRLAGAHGTVLSAEPDPVARAWAERNLLISRDGAAAPVIVLPGGLSSAPGELRLYASTVMGHSSFALPHHGTERLSVPVVRGDDWLESLGVRRIDVMVLDVEGWEVHALRGLERTIARSPRLRAMVEVADWALHDAGSTPAELFDFWRRLGFEVRWARHHGRHFACGVWGPVAAADSREAGDVLCVRDGAA